MICEYKNPFLSTETNLEIAIGAVRFHQDVIENLRNQIENLRVGLLEYKTNKEINYIQYAHQDKESHV